MTKTILSVMMLAVALSGCASVKENLRKSSLNPAYWFGKQPEAIPEGEADPVPIPVDPRPLAGEVVDLKLERIPGGAILRATALPATQGWWDAALVAAPAGEGLLVFDIRAWPPEPGRPGAEAPEGGPASRVLTVALYLTDNDMAGIGRIMVRGLGSEKSVRP